VRMQDQGNGGIGLRPVGITAFQPPVGTGENYVRHLCSSLSPEWGDSALDIRLIAGQFYHSWQREIQA
jgi:hypothetical protein